MISMNAEVERPQSRVRRYNSPRRPGDDQLRAVLNGFVVEHQSRVRRVVANAVRFEDLHMVDDFTQDVWLEAWQYLLRGNEAPTRPGSFLSRLARNKVTRHYKLARVRREMAVDPQDYGPLERLCAELAGIGAGDER
ncbi:sigma-70 family RNA polymerase sigma factor [Streptomyces lunaelactis]|nr:sigma-70 family RNA polymerase sigma factor [Streptomyces lunaelactis]